MIECVECGTENDDRAVFCQNPSCGALLEWSGRKKVEAVPVAAAPTERAAEEETITSASPAGDATVRERTGPRATKPGREFVPPPARAVEAQLPPGVGELVCQRCGAGNLPHLHFCRRCGATLADAPVVRPTWRQRLLRRPPPPAAGERRGWTRPRPQVRRDVLARSALVGLAAVAAAAVLALGALLAWRAGGKDAVVGAYDSVRSALFPRYEPVRPIAERATSARPRHPADAAFDQDVNTFWVAGPPGRGTGARLIVRFERGTDLARIGVFAGDPVARHLVPERLQLSFFRRRAKPSRRWSLAGIRMVRLENKPGFQQTELDVEDVDRLVITVRRTYRSDTPRASAALTEIEFFRRK